MNGHIQEYLNYQMNLVDILGAKYCSLHNECYQFFCLGCHLDEFDKRQEQKKQEEDRRASFDYDEETDNQLSFNR